MNKLIWARGSKLAAGAILLLLSHAFAPVFAEENPDQAEAQATESTNTPPPHPQVTLDPFEQKIRKACQNINEGEQAEVDGLMVTCEKKYKQALDMEVSSLLQDSLVTGGGKFVRFNDKYLKGLFLTTSFGYSNYSTIVSFTDLERREDAYQAAGLSGDVEGGKHGYGLNINLGYVAHPFVMVELGYSYLGTASIYATLTDGDVNYTDDIKTSMSSLDLNIFGRYPMSAFMNFPQASKMHALAVLGLHRWSRHTTSTFTTPAQAIIDEVDSNGFGVCYGAGVQYKHNAFVSARAVWHYKFIGNEGVGSLMLTAFMQNHTLYGKAIQNKIVNPIAGMFKKK